jgi:alpha-L-fucosidase
MNSAPFENFQILILMIILPMGNIFAQSQPDPRLKWWQEARFGMFIHWGPVSLKGTEIGWSRGKQVPIEEYDNLYKSFNPTEFSAEEWVKTAKDAGMKYLVITAKHHDGFCLWETQTTDYNIMNTPFGRDVVKELAEECRKQGIVFCTYYSVLDWYHPDYNIDSRGGPGYPLPPGQKPDMDRYVSYMKTQLKELVQNYGPIGVMWFDGEWEDPWTHEMGLDLYEYVRSLQDDIIINNRVDKGRKGMEGITLTDKKYAGDFDTPEQEVGKFQTDRPWETCMTIARQWAWKPNDDLKSLDDCLKILVETVGGDGNLLLNVGPMPNGEIEERQVERLKEIGDWLDKHGESIFGTRGGPYQTAEWGVSTFKENRIYLHLLNSDVKKLRLDNPEKKLMNCYFLNGPDLEFQQNKENVTIDISNLESGVFDQIIVLNLE